MSRWAEQFESHPFQSDWAAIKNALSDAEVDDETVTTTVAELARLQKVVAYIDEILSAIDPELVPLGTWDQFRKQSHPCLNQLNAYNSNKDINALTQANAHADNLLTYVRPYMILHGEAASALQNSIRSYSRKVDEMAGESLKRARATVRESEAIRDDIAGIKQESSESQKAILSCYDEIFRENESEPGIKLRIERFEAEAERIYDLIGSLHDELLVDEEGNASVRSSIIRAHADIEEQKEKSQKLIREIQAERSAILAFYAKVFGEGESDDESEEESKPAGMSAELEMLMKKMQAFEKNQSTRYSALNDQIESLLPGATSAGLASAYAEMKRQFAAPIKIYSRLFYAAIVALLAVSAFVAIEAIGPGWSIKFIHLEDWQAVVRAILNKMPFYLPVIWLGFFASRRRSEAQRLEQEYAHKEALAKSYENFKRQLDELDADDLEMRKAFISSVVDAVAFNASTTLDGKHGDKTPAQLLFSRVRNSYKEAGGGPIE